MVIINIKALLNAIVVLVSLILAVFITVFMNQESRTEELQNKMEQLLNKKQD